MAPYLRSVDQLRQGARRALPGFVFDYVDGGALGEQALARNRDKLNAVRLAPHVLSGRDDRSIATRLFGRAIAAPFGIAPIGMANLVRPGTDKSLARVAQAGNIPYVLSTVGTTSLEAIHEVAPDSWFQLYVARDAAIVDDLIRRADVAGYPVLVVTADAPTSGKRLRDLSNHFTLPLRPSLRFAADLVGHPRWSWHMLRGGAPRFANLIPYAPPRTSIQLHAKLMADQSCARLDWDLLARIRDRWPRPLVLKGVLRPDDALRAIKIGVDAIGVSNHGGRQLDAAPAPIEVLPVIRAAVPVDFPLILDGGVRSGEDIARALALGANLVLLGRPFLFAIAALGLAAGPAALIAMLADELDRTLGLLGCTTITELDSSLLFDDSPRSPEGRRPVERSALESGRAPRIAPHSS